MGKGSRLRRQREQEQGLPRGARRRATRANARGQRVPATVEAYERVCASGSDRLITTLIARYTRRMDLIQSYPDAVKRAMFDCLGPITVLDKVLLAYGARPERAPSDFTGEWPDHLAWGVDSAVAAVRLMLCGQFVGAAAVARNQMERWLVHRASSLGVSQESGESTLDFVARVWSQPDIFTEHWFHDGAGLVSAFDGDDVDSVDEPGPVHEHVRLTDGTEICPAVLYGFMSELMHGRMLVDAVRWESHTLLDGDDLPDEVWVAAGSIADSLSLSLRQVRYAALTLAAERGDLATVAYLNTPLDRFSPAEPEPDDQDSGAGPSVRSAQQRAHERPTFRVPQIALLAPLQPGEALEPERAAVVFEMSDAFEEVLRGKRPAGRLFRDDELTTLAFAWHRGRSIKTAMRALDVERKHYGEAFDERTLSGRTVRWAVLSEATSLVGGWLPIEQQGAALAVVGSGIRSAYWLWLEDDDRAMAVLRTVLEQTARSRTWRTKPAKAERLESRVGTRPRDWIEAAGWRRLTPLNTALGEFAHVKATSRWSGARILLTDFQLDADPEVAAYTARGAALEFVTTLAASEVAESANAVSETIAQSLSRALEFLSLMPDLAGPAAVEEQFNHIWSLRMAGLGPSMFTQPGD